MATSFYHHPPHHRPQTMHGLNVSSSQSDPRSLPSPGSALPPIRSIIPDFDKLDMDYGRRQSQAHKDTIDGGHSQGYTTDRLPTTGSSPSIPVFSQHSHGQQDSGARTHLDGPLPRLPPSDAFAQHNGYHQNSEPRRGYPQYGQHQPIYRQDSYPPHGYPQDSYYPPLEHRHGPFPQPGSQQNFYEQRARSERLHYAHPWGGHSDSAVSPRGGDGGKNKRRGNLPKEVTEKLYAWLYGHLNHPYPTEDEKQKMMRETNMQMNQISNWFINARRRKVPLLIEQAKAETEAAKHYRPNSSPIARRTRPVSVSHTRHYSRSGPGRGVPSRRSVSVEPSINNLLNCPESDADVRPPQYATPMSDRGVLDYSSRESSESYEMDSRYQSYGHGHGHGHHASI
ncbi:homeobox KN domain-containing protein [Neurospora intermedia]|uniref:Homeobox KN domain-containing protein n=1 Tax=Neurospora intermedia TaxID=5142 RepID=A0ABR3DLK1_NEUIN